MMINADNSTTDLVPQLKTTLNKQASKQTNTGRKCFHNPLSDYGNHFNSLGLHFFYARRNN